MLECAHWQCVNNNSTIFSRHFDICVCLQIMDPQKDLEKRIVAFENNCYRRLLHLHCTTQTTNVEIRRGVVEHTGKYDTLLEIIMKMTLRQFGHVVRAKGTLANTILLGEVEMKRS